MLVVKISGTSQKTNENPGSRVLHFRNNSIGDCTLKELLYYRLAPHAHCGMGGFAFRLIFVGKQLETVEWVPAYCT